MRRQLPPLALEVRQLRDLLPPEEASVSAQELPIRVYCRFRAQNDSEEFRGGNEAWEPTGSPILNTVNVAPSAAATLGPLPQYTFDRVFGPEASQDDVFAEVQPVVQEVLEDGGNSSILCYGQTSAGKTFTIEGDEGDLRGILPRALETVFATLDASPSLKEVSLHVSMLEIYMEKLRDLLVDGTDLSVAEDRHQGVVVRGLQEVPVQNLQHALEVWHHGRHQRITAATGMNDRSSRSHCIFTLHVTRDGTTSKLSIVDLAGSECVKKIFMPGKSHAANRETVEEAKAINQSLSTLGLVINRLARSKGRNIDTHVPYRSSKLTRVLQDSIGGGSRTALLLNCSISSLQVAETLSTLRFGTRARSCVNVVPTGNCEEPMLLKTLRAARQELQRLQARAWPREMDDEDDTPFSGLSALSHEQESVSIVDVEFNSPESGALRPRFVQHGLELSLVQEAEGSEENEDLPRGRQSVASGFRRSTCSRRTSRRMSRHSRQSGVMRSHPASVPTSPRWNQGLCMSSVSFCGPDGCTECWEHPLTKSEKRSRLIAILTKELSGADAELTDVQAMADDLERRCEALQAETEWLRVEYGAAETTTGNPSVREMTACCAAAYVQCLTGHIAKQISGASEVLEQDLAALREETQRQDQHTAGETISKPAKGLKKLEKEKGKKMDKEQLEQTVEELQRKLEKTGVESRLQTNLLHEEKQALKEEARRQEEIIQKLQQQFNAESAGRQKAVERAEGLQKDIEKVNGKKMDKQSEKDELRRSKEQLEQTVEELQRKLEKADVESRLQTNLLDEEKQALKEEARMQEEIIQKLQQQFNAESAGRQKAVERAEGLQKDIEKVNSKKMDKQSEADELRRGKEQLKQTVEELQKKLEKAGVESDSAKRLLKDFRLQTDLLDEEKQALKEEARRQEEIIQKLQQQFNAESAGRQKAVERAEGLQKDIEKVNGKKMDKQSEADELRRQTNSEKAMQILCRSGRYAWLLRLLFVLTVWFLQTSHKEHVSASSAPDPSLGIGSDSASAPVAFYQEVQEEIALDTKQILEEEASVEERAETTPNASVDQEEPLFPYERYDGDRERQLIIPANQASTRRNTTRPSGRIHGEEMAAWSALPIFTAFASLAFGYAG